MPGIEDRERAIALGQKVRDAYWEIYGEDLTGGGTSAMDIPIAETVLVCLAIRHMDGDTTNITLYDGSWLEALGLARTAIYNLLPSED